MKSDFYFVATLAVIVVFACVKETIEPVNQEPVNFALSVNKLDSACCDTSILNAEIEKLSLELSVVDSVLAADGQLFRGVLTSAYLAWLQADRSTASQKFTTLLRYWRLEIQETDLRNRIRQIEQIKHCQLGN